jgi:hypothetical protein
MPNLPILHMRQDVVAMICIKDASSILGVYWFKAAAMKAADITSNRRFAFR